MSSKRNNRFHQSSQWYMTNFSRSECILPKVRTTPDSDKKLRKKKKREFCKCGRDFNHVLHPECNPNDLAYSTRKRTLQTQELPTNAFGTLEFRGTGDGNKAKFLRFSYSTNETLETISEGLMFEKWRIPTPNLYISVYGDESKQVGFSEQLGNIKNYKNKARQILGDDIIKAADTTNACIITSALYSGTGELIGESLNNYTQTKLSNITLLGISPWGVVQNRDQLIRPDDPENRPAGIITPLPYETLSTNPLKQRHHICESLNPYCGHFLLVDDGSVGKLNRESKFRKAIERRLSRGNRNKSLSERPVKEEKFKDETPLVYIVIGGDRKTLLNLIETASYEQKRSKFMAYPVQVIICFGTGGTADLLSLCLSYYDTNRNVIDHDLKPALLEKISKTYNIKQKQAQETYLSIEEFLRYHKAIHIYNSSDLQQSNLASNQENTSFEYFILGVAIKSRSQSAMLDLAQKWNRPDLARSIILPKILSSNTFPERTLFNTFLNALVTGRVEFLKLIMESGVSIHKCLNIDKLEDLYHLVKNKQIDRLLQDQARKLPERFRFYNGKRPTIVQIGILLEKLLGGAYRSNYTRKKFRNYVEEKNDQTNNADTPSIPDKKVIQRFSSIFKKKSGKTSENKDVEKQNLKLQNCDSKKRREIQETFKSPFTELFLWSVLLQRQELALFFWEIGEDALAKALIAIRIYRQLAKLAEEEDIDTNNVERLNKYADEFSDLAMKLLDASFKADQEQAKTLLTYEMDSWSRRTNLNLAYAAKHYQFFEHASVQALLQDLWIGGLHVSNFLNSKIVVSVFCLPITTMAPGWLLTYKTAKQIENQPCQLAEHLDENVETDRSDISSSISSSSESSSDSSIPDTVLTRNSRKKARRASVA